MAEAVAQIVGIKRTVEKTDTRWERVSAVCCIGTENPFPVGAKASERNTECKTNVIRSRFVFESFDVLENRSFVGSIDCILCPSLSVGPWRWSWLSEFGRGFTRRFSNGECVVEPGNDLLRALMRSDWNALYIQLFEVNGRVQGAENAARGRRV